MIPVLLWELTRRKMFTIWWSIGVSALVGLTILSYIALEDQTQQLDQVLGDFSSLGSFVGGNDLFSPAGYLSSQVYYIMLPLLLIIMVLTLVSSLMSKDENDTTVELTLARPLSRSALLVGKAVSGSLILVIVFAVSFAVAVVSVLAADLDVSIQNLLVTHFTSFVFSASFGAITFALIAFNQATRKVAGIIAIFLSFGGYIIASLASFVDVLKPVAKLLPYHYYDTASLLRGTYDTGLIIYLVGAFVLSAAVAWFGYTRRDIG